MYLDSLVYPEKKVMILRRLLFHVTGSICMAGCILSAAGLQANKSPDLVNAHYACPSGYLETSSMRDTVGHTCTQLDCLKAVARSVIQAYRAW
jgi:hypothetical protein